MLSLLCYHYCYTIPMVQCCLSHLPTKHAYWNHQHPCTYLQRLVTFQNFINKLDIIVYRRLASMPYNMKFLWQETFTDFIPPQKFHA